MSALACARVIVIALAACTRPDVDTGDAATSVRLDERRVQAAVLDSFFVRPGVTRLVIGDSTVRGANHFVDEDYKSAMSMLGDLPNGLREDFERKRADRIPLGDLPTRVPHVSFDTQDRAALLTGAANPAEYWQRFYTRFPASSGRVSLSRVGFSRDHRYAMMLVDYGCGGRCGGTVYYLLARQGNSWHTIREAQPRIS